MPTRTGTPTRRDRPTASRTWGRHTVGIVRRIPRKFPYPNGVYVLSIFELCTAHQIPHSNKTKRKHDLSADASERSTPGICNPLVFFYLRILEGVHTPVVANHQHSLILVYVRVLSNLRKDFFKRISQNSIQTRHSTARLVYCE